MMSTILRPVKCCLMWRIALGAIACGLPGAGWACDTPVYRYALYHWTTAPYHIVYFKQGTPSASDGEIARLVGKLGEGEAAANLVLDTFDPAHDKIDEMPEPVQAAWKARKDAKPAYLVLTPQGVAIFAGRLEASMLRPMTDSPVRRKLCQQLDDGKAVVFLLVPGKDPAENRRARKAVEELVAQAGVAPVSPQAGVAAGANKAAPVSPQAGAGPVSPGGQAGPREPVEESSVQTTAVKLGLIEVSRSDPAEPWLIRAMMAVEPDLAGLVDQPMVFAVYGRARVLEPYVGKGITVDNLSQLVEFVTGACSCQVKDANPGVDLLTTWNWDATAARMAAKDSPLDPAAGGYAEIGTKDVSASAGDGKASAKRVASGEWRVASEDIPGRHGAAPGAKTKDAGTAVQTAGTPLSSLATRHSPLATPSFASRLAWRLGLGMLVGAAVVLAAGLVLARHRGPV
jgi:hypothetical protein